MIHLPNPAPGTHFRETMLKKVLSSFVFLALLAGCSSLRPLSFTGNKQVSSSDNTGKNDIKFLDISSDADESGATKSNIKGEMVSGPRASVSTTTNSDARSTGAESSSGIRMKYSQLLNTEPQQIQNIPLYRTIDDWYGTRYKLGGTSKSGIDCSAFVQTIFVSVFAVTLPRTAKEQYKATHHISRTQLQEGDLLFFNTTGGVSHVGIYLQNNKFVHASVSGVVISDMFEPYYVRHFIAAGRVAGLNGNSSASLNP